MADGSVPPDPEFDAAIEECRRALNERRLPEQSLLDQWLARWPDFVIQLREYLSAEEQLLWMTGTLGSLFGDITLQTLPWSDAPVHPRDRYRPDETFLHYDLLELISRGSFSQVFRARDRRDDRIVALKLVAHYGYHSELDRESELVRFRPLLSMVHPGIVRLYEVGEHEGRVYFAMEYCGGGSLADRIRRDYETGRVGAPPEEAAQIIADLADALQTMHDYHIIHRDLKPTNILFTADGQPKIADFGLAFWPEPDPEMPAAITGTPAYMAPEQWSGHVVPESDVFSLGVILYELIAGRRPFRATMMVELAMQIIREDPEPPCRINPSVPRDLEAICLHCLEKKPEQRYATARDLAEDLRRFLNGEPISIRSPSFLNRLWHRWRGR